MVLSRSVAVASIAALLLSACATPPAPKRLSTSEPVATVVVVDSADAAAIPETVPGAIDGALRARNLEPSTLVVDEALRSARLTPRRLAVARTQAGERHLLLVEVQASFYSQLNGLFRWVVSGKATFRPRGSDDLALVEVPFEQAVFLRLAHEGQDQAIGQAQGAIVRAVELAVDGWLAAPSVTVPASPPAPPTPLPTPSTDAVPPPPPTETPHAAADAPAPDAHAE